MITDEYPELHPNVKRIESLRQEIAMLMVENKQLREELNIAVKGWNAIVSVINVEIQDVFVEYAPLILGTEVE